MLRLNHQFFVTFILLSATGLAQRGANCQFEYEGGTYVNPDPRTYFFGYNKNGKEVSPFLGNSLDWVYIPKTEVKALYALAKTPVIEWRNKIKFWSNSRALGDWNEVFKVSSNESGGYKYNHAFSYFSPYTGEVKGGFIYQIKETDAIQIAFANSHFLERLEAELTPYYCGTYEDSEGVRRRQYSLVLGSDLVHYSFLEAELKVVNDLFEIFDILNPNPHQSVRVWIE